MKNHVTIYIFYISILKNTSYLFLTFSWLKIFVKSDFLFLIANLYSMGGFYVTWVACERK